MWWSVIAECLLILYFFILAGFGLVFGVALFALIVGLIAIGCFFCSLDDMFFVCEFFVFPIFTAPALFFFGAGGSEIKLTLHPAPWDGHGLVGSATALSNAFYVLCSLPLASVVHYPRRERSFMRQY